jgi:hypothetical protein
MANNEGVDIIIKATDQYTATINKISASNELFGRTIKNIEKEIAALENYMIKLVASGMKPTSASIKILQMNLDALKGTLLQTQNAANGAGNAIGSTANNLKKSNQAYTNLALVIQDLPYGFRGIQNNLPALIGGFAGMTGGLYLAGSAIIALFTAMDNGLIKFGNSVKLTTDYSKEAANTFASESVQLDSLYRVSQDVTVSMGDRIKAAELLKTEYPGLLGFYSAEDIALGKATESYDKLREAVWAYAKVKAAEKVLIELGAKQNEITIKKNKIVADQKDRDIKGLKTVNYLMYNNLTLGEQFNKFVNDLPVNGAFGPIVNSLQEMQKSTDLLNDVNKEQENLNNTTKDYQDIIDGNILLSQLFKEVQKPEPTQKLNQDTSLLERLKKEQKLYKDNLGMFYSYGSLIIKEEERLAVERAEFEKASANEIKNIRAGFVSDMIVNQQEYGRAIMSEAEKNTKALEKNEENIAKIIISNREQIAEAIKQINSDINTENIKNVQTELDQTLKATRGSYNAQKEAYQIAIDKLKEKKAALDAAGISTEEYRKKIVNLEAGMGGLVDPVEQLNQSLQSAFGQLNNDLVTGFAENIGEMLAGGEFDFTKLGSILADGLASIGKALIAFALTNGAVVELFKDPKTWPLALAAGIAAVAAGTALKSKINNNKATAFANGGIVSGPTMGLVGEYPGAQNNPEVIAPLDKLKDMIGGGGGGTFVLRGQDLLLSVNRAQKASNLKGQNISLA